MSTDAHKLAQGQLSTIDCVAQSLAVGPVFSGALLGGILAGLSGGVGLFAIVLTTIGIFGLGRIVSEFAKRYAGSGTVYEFIARSLGKRPAVFAAGTYHLAATALAGPGISIIGGMLLKDFAMAHWGVDWPWWVFALFVAVLILVINMVGIQVSVKAQLTLIVLSVIPFLVLFVKVVADGGVSGNNLHALNPGNVAAGGSAFKGIMFAILMFVGFELSAALGEETKDPKRSIPRAVIATIAIVGSFYLITQYILAVGTSPDENGLFPPFQILGEQYLNRFFGIWIELAVILDVLAVGIGFQLAAARGFFSLGRDGVMPKIVSKTNAKQQPIGGALTVFGITIVCVVLALVKYGTDVLAPTATVGGKPDGAAGWHHVFDAFLATTVIGGMLICLVYLLVCVGAIKLFATKNPLDLGAAVLGLGTCGLGVVAQFIDGTAPLPSYSWGRVLGLILVVLVAIWAAIAKKDVIERVAQHAIEH